RHPGAGEAGVRESARGVARGRRRSVESHEDHDLHHQARGLPRRRAGPRRGLSGRPAGQHLDRGQGAVPPGFPARDRGYGGGVTAGGTRRAIASATPTKARIAASTHPEAKEPVRSRTHPVAVGPTMAPTKLMLLLKPNAVPSSSGRTIRASKV